MSKKRKNGRLPVRKDSVQVVERESTYPYFMNKLKESYKNILEKWNFAKKPFVMLIAIYAIAFSAIIRANFSYVDDIGRTYSGYKNWGLTFSRYLSDFLSTFIHGDNYLTDVSPLPQFLAIILLALSSVIVIYVISEKREISIWQIIAVLPLGLSPYFLECISFKFDAPYMALSILVSVIPLLFVTKRPLIYSAAVFLGTLAMCMTYQVSSGIFPMLVALLCFKRWNEGTSWKDVFKFLFPSVLSYGLGLVFFQLFLLKSFDGYVSNTLPPLHELPYTIYHNLKRYFSLVISDFQRIWILLIILLFLSFLYIAVCNSKQKKRTVFPVAAAVLCVMPLMCFGLYPLLSAPLFRARAMYGFGVMIAFLAVFDVSAKKVYPVKFISFALSWLFFVFSFTYGNAIFSQQEYEDFRIQMAINTMNELPVFSTDEVKKVQLKGSVRKAPSLENSIKHFPILDRLVPVTFYGSDKWGYYKFANCYKLKNITPVSNLGIDYELPILTDTMYFTIRGDNQYILIELK